MIKVSDYIFKFIADQNVKHVFLLSGGGAMHLVDSLGRCKDIHYICNLHEQAAAIAADAYSQFSGNLGVALVTTGPGGTNAITGVAASWLDSIPCLILSGQVKRADLTGDSRVRQMGNQELPIVDIVKPITKYAVTILKPQEVRYHLEKAVFLARSGRPGPVWLDIPLDVQAGMVEENELKPFVPETNEMEKNSAVAAVSNTVELLKNTQKPVILVGNGIRLSNSLDEFEKLAAHLKIPILTTWKAADIIDANNSLYCGRPGVIGQRAANWIQQNADFILVLGARLDLMQTGYNHRNFAAKAKKVIVDVDESELKKLDMPIDVLAAVDTKTFLKELLDHVRDCSCGKWGGWLSDCKARYAKYPVCLPEYWKQDRFVNTYVLVEVLSELMNSDDILIPSSSGQSAEITLQAFKVKKGQRVINSPGLGAMGFGLPHSIGACIASGKKRVVCIDGDGGIQLNIQDLATIQALNLPVKVFVLNNSGYGSIRNTQKNYFNGFCTACDETSGVKLPDIRNIAHAYGIKTYMIENHGAVWERVAEVLSTSGPVICEVMTAPDQLTVPRLVSKKLEDGSMVTNPMEELWPYENVELL